MLVLDVGIVIILVFRSAGLSASMGASVLRPSLVLNEFAGIPDFLQELR